MSAAASLLALVSVLAAGTPAPATSPTPQVRVGPANFKPAFLNPGIPEEGIPVEGFLLDRHAVTNAQFLAFVKQHPEWRRDQVKPLYADPQYLAHWSGPVDLGPQAPAFSPVTRVSWFAARAYCRAQHRRLPTEDEWELAASAGSEAPGFEARILSWFSQPTPKVLPRVERSEPNPLGLYDLHGLVWEWVEDFGATQPGTGPSCGTGATTATDRENYAAFMRVAFRSSLQGRYTVGNLGFRCAADLPTSSASESSR